ncbi:cardiolipin synthase ClsB [Castellaniella sp. UC4442_H9]|jgi:cardiolipin synthase|nr:cardiolipin synthase ClsB [Castellaniella sp.]
MSADWYAGNHYELLENGDEFFPAVIAAIREAKREVLVESFILFDDRVGQHIQATLADAASRGLTVRLTLDGYGSGELATEFLNEMVNAGVHVHLFDPHARLLGLRTHLFRRLHRKLVVIDEQVAFVGGINYSADHLTDDGAQAKQDYSVRITGPLCAHIGAAMRQLSSTGPRTRYRPTGTAAPSEEGAGRLIVRDNHRHRDDIEHAYRASLRASQSDVLIANAYFFPGYRLIRDLTRAARRGVRVRLILQGQPDMRIAQFAASMIYDYLLEAGVQIYEYRRRPLHAKVACFDDEWVTIGSSNLDPFSLALNLEANLLARDRSLNQALRDSLSGLLARDCHEITRSADVLRPVRRMWAAVVVFHVLRWLPAWAGRLPAHKPRVERIRPDES